MDAAACHRKVIDATVSSERDTAGDTLQFCTNRAIACCCRLPLTNEGAYRELARALHPVCRDEPTGATGMSCMRSRGAKCNGGAGVPDAGCLGRQVVSTMGTTLLEDVAAAAPDPSQHMFQLYVIKDRDFTRQLVQVCWHRIAVDPLKECQVRSGSA